MLNSSMNLLFKLRMTSPRLPSTATVDRIYLDLLYGQTVRLANIQQPVIQTNIYIFRYDVWLLVGAS